MGVTEIQTDHMSQLQCQLSLAPIFISCHCQITRPIKAVQLVLSDSLFTMKAESMFQVEV